MLITSFFNGKSKHIINVQSHIASTLGQGSSPSSAALGGRNDKAPLRRAEHGIIVHFRRPDWTDVSGGNTTNGGKLHQWDCNESNINQSWNLDAIDSTWFQLRSRHSQKCVDVEGSSTANGARIFQKSCDTTKQSQHLRFE